MVEETSTYSWSRFYTVNRWLTEKNTSFLTMRSGEDSNSDLRCGRLVCYHCLTVAPCKQNSTLHPLSFKKFPICFTNSTALLKHELRGREEDTKLLTEPYT